MRDTTPPSRSGGQPAVPLAVALHHERGADATPVVVASGRGPIAEAILELAFAAGIKVREDKDLAEMLHAVGIGEQIPLAAFAAVAEILARLYAANAASGGPR
jgi:flagellar biosynthesis protein